MDPSQQIQYVPAPGATRSSIMSKTSSAVARNSTLVTAILIALVLLVCYMAARANGWIGGRPRAAASPKPTGRRRGASKSRDKEEADDATEIDRLIDALEG
jgi:hypothetical protein